MPASVATPAVISDTYWPSGQPASIFGYGCNVRSPESGADTKRDIQITWGSASTALCHGDSGGPVFTGNPASNGQIIGVNSTFTTQDGFGDAVWAKPRIEETLRYWNNNYEVNFDRPGYDYTTFAATAANQCSAACALAGQCRAWTFFNNTCYLKSGVPDKVPAQGITSGLALESSSGERDGGDYASFANVSYDSCATLCGRDVTCQSFTYLNSTCYLKSTVPSVTPNSSALSGARHGYQIGIDRPGGDYRNQSGVNTLGQCSLLCAADANCMTFSYVFSTKTCWLKNVVPPPVPNSGVTSGVRRGWEVETDRGGNDLYSVVQSDPSPATCQTTCNNDSNCWAWTLVTSAVSGENRCWIKNNAGTATRSFGMISGRKGMEFF